MLKVIILGSSAGGGFPQWNCNCDNCSRYWAGDPVAVARTQSSLAVSVDDENWFLLNASPDLRQQIQVTPALHPKSGKRHSPIVGAILTNADVDHIGGLITPRESHPLALYGTKRVMSVLNGNNLFNILNPKFVDRRDLPVHQSQELQYKDGTDSGLIVELFPVPGKVALYLEDESKGDNFGSVPEDTVGLKISSKEGGESFYYLPGCSAMPEELCEKVRGADLVFFDGTTWIDEEMIKTGCGVKTGQRMGHMCMEGPEGSIAAFADLNVKRKVFVHMNNTNPVIMSDSAEHKVALKSGWEIGFDGMEITV